MVLQRNEKFKLHRTSTIQVASRHGTAHLKVLKQTNFKSKGRIEIFKTERLTSSRLKATISENVCRVCSHYMKGGRGGMASKSKGF